MPRGSPCAEGEDGDALDASSAVAGRLMDISADPGPGLRFGRPEGM